MNPTIDLSIIIVSWNSQEWISRCLKSIFAQTSDVSFEVIVVDNASEDKTVQVIMNSFPQVSVLANVSNRGFAAAVNRGMIAAKGKYVCWLNPDTEIQDRALEQLVALMEQDESIGVCAPQLHNQDGSTQASVRRFPTWKDQSLILLKLHGIWPDANAISRYLARDFDYTRQQDVDQVMGACMMVRRRLIDAIGSLDNRFFIWFEEVDFCYRTKTETAFRVVYAPFAHVLHLGGDSFEKVAPGKKQRWYRQSLRRYMQKRRFWGTVLLLWILTPASWVTGAIVRVFARTKRGKQAVSDHKQNIKRI